MEIKDLNIGDDVYVRTKIYCGYIIGTIIGETKKYWNIQFGKSASLFSKDGLRQRGGDDWNTTHAYTLTPEERVRIIGIINIKNRESHINSFLQDTIELKSKDQGDRIISLINKIKLELSQKGTKTQEVKDE